MNLLYIARNCRMGEIISFVRDVELVKFAKKEKYNYQYYSIPFVQEFIDENLFLESGDDPSDFL